MAKVGKNQIDVNDPVYKAQIAAGESGTQIQKDYMASLEEQVAQTSALPLNIQTAFKSNRSGLQSKAAQSLAASKQARGGRGIAAARGGAIQSGMALGSLSAQSELDKGSALQEAAKAKTAFTAERKKEAEAASLGAAQIKQAIADVRQIVDDESGVFVTTQADIDKMIARFNSEIGVKYANNPAALQQAITEFNNMMSNEETTELITSTYDNNKGD